jgi:hypothetical protein
MKSYLKQIAKEIVENEVKDNVEYDISMFIETYNLLLTGEQEQYLIKEIDKQIKNRGNENVME